MASAPVKSINLNWGFMYIYCTTGTDQKIMNINVMAYFIGEMIYLVRLLMCVRVSPIHYGEPKAQQIPHLVSFVRINYHFCY